MGRVSHPATASSTEKSKRPPKGGRFFVLPRLLSVVSQTSVGPSGVVVGCSPHL